MVPLDNEFGQLAQPQAGGPENLEAFDGLGHQLPGLALGNLHTPDRRVGGLFMILVLACRCFCGQPGHRGAD